MLTKQLALGSEVALTFGFSAVAQDQDFSAVKIETQQLADGLYMLTGEGGNIALSTGPDGSVLVDTQFAPLNAKILAAVRAAGGGDVKYVINTPGETVVCRKVKVRRDGGWLRIALPSGRALCYPAPQIDKKTGAITYMGLNQYTRQWERISTYGGKALEQCTQATACDQLGDCMLIVEADGYEGVFHVHDELACEVPDTEVFTHERVAELLCSDLGWNAGLPLAAAGFTCYRYRKE